MTRPLPANANDVHDTPTAPATALDAMRPDLPAKLRSKLTKLGVHSIRRHILLCADTGECGCASASQMKDSWKYLKKRLKQLGLSQAGGVARSRTQCLDLCKAGPIAIVYPEGTWYGWCHEENLERIIQSHLVQGRIVDDLVLARPGLDNGADRSQVA